MAAADYYGCDVCGAKTFYDANLDYDCAPPTYEPTLPGVGQMKVICKACAEHHEIVIQPARTGGQQ